MIKKRISRRRLLQTATLGLTGALLTACADTSPGQPTPNPTQTTPQTPTLQPQPGPTSLPATPEPPTQVAPTVAPPTATTIPVTPAPTLTPAPDPAQLAKFPVEPYISRAQQLAPLFEEPNQSFYLQPWRGFVETRRADSFLAGIGINYNLPDGSNDPAILKLLADNGFKAIRLEISWNMVTWEEDGFGNQTRLNTILATCKMLNITPLILLNANDGGPGPNRTTKRTLKAAASKGARTLQLDAVTDLVVGKSGLSTGSLDEDGFMAEMLFTGLDPNSGTVQLSKPLRFDLAAGQEVAVNTLKYAPFYPVGTPQFEETTGGWLKYVRLVTGLLAKNGITDYELEIWNELSFGSKYLSINNYYDPPLLPEVSEPNSLLPGGSSWEFARRTAEQVKKSENTAGASMIWGFSNTTFYHTPVPELPAGLAGQSYHPYGTDRKIIPQDYPPKERYDWFIEKYIPQNLAWCMPEGWAHLGLQTETLMRLLNPETRLSNLPPGGTAFAHYMTEHGFLPEEAGISDPKVALEYKAKALVRAVLFWLNKGISKMYLFSAYQPTDLEQGMLLAPPNKTGLASATLAGSGEGEDSSLVSPALKALKALTDLFADGETSAQFEPRQLAIEVTALGDQPEVFEGDGGHPPLYYRDMTAVLPFQGNANRFLVAFYTMSYDVTRPFPGLTVRIALRNLPGGQPKVLLFDPVANLYVLSQEIEFLADGGVAVTVTTRDYPLIITLDYS